MGRKEGRGEGGRGMEKRGEKWSSDKSSGKERGEEKKKRDSTITDDGYDTACLALIKFLDSENTSTKRGNLVPWLFFF